MNRVVRNNLRYEREKSRLTQMEVAKILGKNSTLVSHHENLTRAMTDDDIKEYARLFKIETHQLFHPLHDAGS